MSAAAGDDPHRLGGALRAVAARLRAAGIETARLDARVLVGHAVGLEPARVPVADDRALTVAERRRLDRLVARRAAREPVSRILGRREFWSLSFRVTPAVLDPRPDSETLVAAVLDALPDRAAPCRLLDLGTGSGCLLLALLSELPAATGLGVDVSAAALRVARANAAALGLKPRARFRQGVWADGLRGGFEVVVANPPYIAAGELAGLPPEVGFDPPGALDGGPDGLDPYRAIAAALPRLLVPGGLAAFEIGATQAPDVAALLAEQGLEKAKIVEDLANNPRVVMARRK